MQRDLELSGVDALGSFRLSVEPEVGARYEARVSETAQAEPTDIREQPRFSVVLKLKKPE